jgi:hypothetical protein
VIGSAIVVVGANDPHLFRDPAIGSLTAIDIAIAATFIRATLVANRRRPTLLEWSALGFLLAAAVATLSVHGNSPTTAYARVASYLIFGLAVGRALGPGGRTQLARAFVGGAIGQAVAALTSLTGTTYTRFPIGRYLGTLGDPAQFGIPIAFAAVLVALSPQIIRSRYARFGAASILCFAVVGSVTRSAWAVLGTGFLLAALTRVGRGRTPATRVAVAVVGVAAVSVGTALVILGASSLGLAQQSAALRGRSIGAAWSYLMRHPLRPIGLGNTGVLEREPVAGGNPIFASNFEGRTSGWASFRDASLAQERRTFAFGTASLNVHTAGRTENEGAQLSAISGIRSDSPYTFSLFAEVPRGITLWLYADEYGRDNRWKAYRYGLARGRGTWKHYSLTWVTSSQTKHVTLYILTASKVAASFFVDGVQLEAGRTASAFDGREIPAPQITRPSAIYNTWLAVTIDLGIVAALLLAALALGAPYHAYKLGDRATAFALTALVVPSITENFVYAASLVTLTWLAALGVAVTAGEPRTR